jgi:hypothetical protein
MRVLTGLVWLRTERNLVAMQLVGPWIVFSSIELINCVGALCVCACARVCVRVRACVRAARVHSTGSG